MKSFSKARDCWLNWDWTFNENIPDWLFDPFLDKEYKVFVFLLNKDSSMFNIHLKWNKYFESLIEYIMFWWDVFSRFRQASLENILFQLIHRTFFKSVSNNMQRNDHSQHFLNLIFNIFSSVWTWSIFYILFNFLLNNSWIFEFLWSTFKILKRFCSPI